MTPRGLKSIAPIYGLNYRRGHVFFIHHLDPDCISRGIAYFQGPPAPGSLIVTHTGIVTGENLCSEAQAIGVKEADLREYFNDPTVAIVMKEPRIFDDNLGNAVANNANTRNGEHYAYSLIFAQFLAKCWLGRRLNGWFSNTPDGLVSRGLDWGNMEFCSEHATKALQSCPAIRDLGGVLSCEARTVDVQELCDSQPIWKPWK